ncbi:MAG: alpha/beta fold hydrolase [Rhodospirillales bacterium]|nr:alpha/beta fold hydrolase [Rhodospirillales bacterium]
MTQMPNPILKQPPVPVRLGPRPLPLHLALQTLTWTSSRAALTTLNKDLLGWRPNLKSRAADLQKNLAGVNPDAFARAVDAEIVTRLQAFAEGVSAYRHHPQTRTLPEPPTVWREGSTRLLDYGVPPLAGAENGVPLLVVPSLINRAYILDLSERRSLLRYLAKHGFRPFLLDWGVPGKDELGFDLSDYIAGRGEAALAAVAEMCAAPVGVIGFCMGGNLVLPLAQRRPELVRAMVLMATPWDFSGMDRAKTECIPAMRPQLDGVLNACGVLPVDMLQAMFVSLDPFYAIRKFRRFATLDPASRKAHDFVALEDWLNDGVPLVAKVARECLFDWYVDNTPERGSWKIRGRPVVPEEVETETLLIVPEQDYIVPPATALPLADHLPHVDCRVLKAGHIGMVAGGRATTLLYAPLVRWLRQRMT